MFSPSGIVTLLTDFGTKDSYVGQVKGAMLTIAPELTIVDLTHGIPPQDVLEGAFQLATSVEAFPRGSVHLAVVDPGVGGRRRVVAVQAKGHIFVGPDNGVLALAVEDRAESCYELTNAALHRAEVTPTFHGRDVFGPVAARLASGQLGIDQVGRALDPNDLTVLDIGPVVQEGDRITGHVVSIDRFGSCLTLIGAGLLPPPPTRLHIECGEYRANALNRTYSDVAPRQAVAVVGSHGALELAARDESAAHIWGIQRGDRVVVRVPSGR